MFPNAIPSFSIWSKEVQPVEIVNCGDATRNEYSSKNYKCCLAFDITSCFYIIIYLRYAQTNDNKIGMKDLCMKGNATIDTDAFLSINVLSHSRNERIVT
jgi:hypothetical protein